MNKVLILDDDFELLSICFLESGNAKWVCSIDDAIEDPVIQSLYADQIQEKLLEDFR